MSLPSGKHKLRSIDNQQLFDYLLIYNRNTMRVMGSIGNISHNGLMLISSVPVLVDSIYSMRIILPNKETAQAQYVDFGVRCHWCKPDINPNFFDSGYSIIESDQHLVELIHLLKHYFSFSQS